MSDRWRLRLLQAAAPVAAMAFALLVSAAILLALGKDPLEVYATMFRFTFGRVDSVGSMLFKATPLIFSGLAVAVSFRVGLFNIGVEGQYLVAAFVAGFLGYQLTGLPAAVHLPLLIVAAAAAGALWAWLPVWLRVRRGAHEVITTIMLNYVAYSLIHYLLTVFIDPNQGTEGGLGSARLRLPEIADSARMPKLHGLLAPLGVQLPDYVHLNGFFLLALALCVLAAWALRHTAFGFELRAVGLNPEAAEAAGIPPERVYVRAFLLSGAVAGLIGLSDLLGYYGFLSADFPRGYGFMGIAVALLAQNHPLGVVAAALLIGFLRRGAEGVQVLADVPMEAVVILEGVIILSIVVASTVLGRALSAWERQLAARAAAGSGDAPGAAPPGVAPPPGATGTGPAGSAPGAEVTAP